ncbi:hypothetical protein SNEBB_005331 [Seison nebaliae]|nr:hypothetical protein SNEBB_005331 [Seison nebaliae]
MFKDGMLYIERIDRTKLKILAIVEKKSKKDEGFQVACHLIIETIAYIDMISCTSILPRIKTEKVIGILVGGNGRRVGSEIYDESKYTINPPPNDLTIVSTSMDHYFHSSFTSTLYQEILYEIYDDGKVVIELRFENNNNPPNTLSWFSNSNLNRARVFYPVDMNVKNALESNLLQLQYSYSIADVTNMFISVKKEKENFAMTIYETCSRNTAILYNLICLRKHLPVIGYQMNSAHKRSYMRVATHVVITGYTLHDLL